jgi:DNA-binding CsgD family transcriptional regulator
MAKPVRVSDVELVEMLAMGMCTKEIGTLLNLRDSTIETYRVRLMRKYKCKNSCHLVGYFYNHKLLKPLNGNEKQGNETYKVGQVGQLWEHDICR